MTSDNKGQINESSYIRHVLNMSNNNVKKSLIPGEVQYLKVSLTIHTCTPDIEKRHQPDSDTLNVTT